MIILLKKTILCLMEESIWSSFFPNGFFFIYGSIFIWYL